MSLHQLKLTGLPSLVKPWLQGPVQAQEDIPTFVGNICTLLTSIVIEPQIVCSALEAGCLPSLLGAGFNLVTNSRTLGSAGTLVEMPSHATKNTRVPCFRS